MIELLCPACCKSRGRTETDGKLGETYYCIHCKKTWSYEPAEHVKYQTVKGPVNSTSLLNRVLCYLIPGLNKKNIKRDRLELEKKLELLETAIRGPKFDNDTDHEKCGLLYLRIKEVLDDNDEEGITNLNKHFNVEMRRST